MIDLVIPPLEDAACLGCTISYTTKKKKKISIAIVFFFINLDVQTNLRVPRLISRVLKLTIM